MSHLLPTHKNAYITMEQPYGDNVTAALKMIRITYMFYSRLLTLLTDEAWDQSRAKELMDIWKANRKDLSCPRPTTSRLKDARAETKQKLSLFTEVELFVRAAVTDLSTHALTRPRRAELLAKLLQICEAKKHRTTILHVAGAYPLLRTSRTQLTPTNLDGPGYVVVFTPNMNTTIHNLENSLDTRVLTAEPMIEECRVFF